MRKLLAVLGSVLILLLIGTAGALATSPLPKPPQDYLTARADWAASMKNTPSPGYTTQRIVDALVSTGYTTDDQGKNVTLGEVCLNIEDRVTDRRGNRVPGPLEFDSGCAPVPATVIAADLSGAAVGPVQIALTHHAFVCPPDIPDCVDHVDQTSPGPTVTFVATWTAVTPADPEVLCLRPNLQLTLTEREPTARGTLDGQDVGTPRGDGYLLHTTLFQQICRN